MQAGVAGDTRVGRRKSGAGVLLPLGAGLAEWASGKVLGVVVLELGAPWGGGAGVAGSDGRVGGGGGGVIGVVVGTEAAIVGGRLVFGVVFGGIGAFTESVPLVVLFGGLIDWGAGGVDEGGADGVVVSEVPLGAVDAGKPVLGVWCV